MTDTKVTITIERNATGYAQHAITVDRYGPDWDSVTGCLFLTDAELRHLAGMLDVYKESVIGEAKIDARLAVTFTDTTGRTP